MAIGATPGIHNQGNSHTDLQSSLIQAIEMIVNNRLEGFNLTNSTIGVVLDDPVGFYANVKLHDELVIKCQISEHLHSWIQRDDIVIIQDLYNDGQKLLIVGKTGKMQQNPSLVFHNPKSGLNESGVDGIFEEGSEDKITYGTALLDGEITVVAPPNADSGNHHDGNLGIGNIGRHDSNEHDNGNGANTGDNGGISDESPHPISPGDSGGSGSDSGHHGGDTGLGDVLHTFSIGDELYRLWEKQPENRGKSVRQFLDSLKGADGKPGRDGRDGTPGINGIDGIDGRDGKDGKSPVVISDIEPLRNDVLWISELNKVKDFSALFHLPVVKSDEEPDFNEVIWIDTDSVHPDFELITHMPVIKSDLEPKMREVLWIKNLEDSEILDMGSTGFKVEDVVSHDLMMTSNTDANKIKSGNLHIQGQWGVINTTFTVSDEFINPMVPISVAYLPKGFTAQHQIQSQLFDGSLLFINKGQNNIQIANATADTVYYGSLSGFFDVPTTPTTPTIPKVASE